MEISRDQLAKCTKINRLFLCSGTVLAKQVSNGECLAAIYRNKGRKEITRLCKFLISVGKPKPQLIETTTEVLLANVPPEWKFQCDNQNRVPENVKPSNYVLFQKAFLCHCSISAGDVMVTQNIAACWLDGGEKLNLTFATNMAASFYLYSKMNWEPEDRRLMSPREVEMQLIKIIAKPEVDAMVQRKDEWILGDLAQFAKKTAKDHQVFQDAEAYAMNHAGEHQTHSWILTGPIGAVTISFLILGIWICCWGRELKGRFKDLHIISLLRSNWQRRSMRMSEQTKDEEKAAKFLRERQRRRMRQPATLRSHVDAALQEISTGPVGPQEVEMQTI